jgi:hypothetical protein
MSAGIFGGESMITITLLAAPLALTLVEFCSAAPEPPARWVRLQRDAVTVLQPEKLVEVAAEAAELDAS